LYDPQVGSVTYGGIDLTMATMASLRERIVVVPQEGFLFNGTIRDNLRIARSTANDEEIDAAVAAIGATEHFATLPDGLDTEVRERGSRLSAGERQLVALARAAQVGVDDVLEAAALDERVGHVPDDRGLAHVPASRKRHVSDSVLKKTNLRRRAQLTCRRRPPARACRRG
jgi:ABC-type transport system involved in cytochrome bd biosynthesis fused ATPase/permease subunit